MTSPTTRAGGGEKLSSTLLEEDPPTPKITRARPHVRHTRAHPYNPIVVHKAAVYRVPPSTLPRQTVLPCQGDEKRGSLRVWLATPNLFRIPKVVELHTDDDTWKCAELAAGGVVQRMGRCMLGDQGTLHVMVAVSDPMDEAIKGSCATAIKGEFASIKDKLDHCLENEDPKPDLVNVENIFSQIFYSLSLSVEVYGPS